MTCRRIAIAAVAVSLLTFVSKIEASSVTFDFVSTSGLSAGKTVAVLVFNTLPATSPSDVTSFDVVYNGIGPKGYYTPTSVSIIGSGSMLVSGTVTAENDNTTVTLSLSGVTETAQITTTAGAGHSLYGHLMLASVPEPSSLLLAGTAVVFGLGIWSRRRVRAQA